MLFSHSVSSASMMRYCPVSGDSMLPGHSRDEPERDLDDHVHLHRLAIARARLELPFAHRLHGALVQALVHAPKKRGLSHTPGLIDHGGNLHFSFDALF